MTVQTQNPILILPPQPGQQSKFQNPDPINPQPPPDYGNSLMYW